MVLYDCESNVRIIENILEQKRHCLKKEKEKKKKAKNQTQMRGGGGGNPLPFQISRTQLLNCIKIINCLEIGIAQTWYSYASFLIFFSTTKALFTNFSRFFF